MPTTSTPIRSGRSVTATLRLIPIEKITVQDGFNPRGQISDDAELDALAQTIRERGLLQPILVRPAHEQTDRFVLVAGERRYRAAVKAQLSEIPAIVRPAQNGDDATLEALTDAVIENELRSAFDPVQRAGAYRAMLDQGCSIRGLAERLGGAVRRSSRERRIRDHLAILELPEDLRDLVAAEKVPLLAVKALVGLCKLHPDLARVAVKSVLDPGEDEEPYTWAEIAEQGLAVAVRNSESLPEGIFETYEPYPLSRFTIGEKAAKQLAAFEKLTGRQLTEVRFSPTLLELVRPLGVVHDIEGWSKIVVGQDVGDRLTEDYIAFQLKAAREQAKRDSENGQPDTAAVAANGAPVGEQSAEQQADEAKRRREQEQQARQQATAFNRQLGVLAIKHLSRIKVDERVIRILTAVDFGAHLRGIAARGARLALPGWPQEETAANGKTKIVYLEVQDAEREAREFLTAGESAGEIAGRAVTLVALAELADEQAIALSRRSFDTQTFAGPFAVQAQRDLYELIAERIKEGQLPQLDRLLAERLERTQARVQREKKLVAA
jgi:ParB/RepB/Spo0J family partition protein